jgi:poly(3-hydroxyoctanoate) depolymerase
VSRRHSNGTEVRQVQVGEQSVTVSIREVANEAPPLLMLHGIGTEHQRWGRTRELMDRTTVAFDVRTEHLGARPSMRTFAKFVARLLLELDMPHVDVIGFSWGGMAAQQLVHDHPAQVRRLVLMSTSPGFMSVPARPSSTRTVMSPHRDAERMPELIRKLYGGDFIDNPDLVQELGLIRPIDEQAYRRQLWALLGWTSVPWLPSLRARTLILHADNDPVFPYVNAALMRGLIRGAILRKVAGGGHLFVLTRPEQSAHQVNAFLDSRDGASH